MSQNTTIRSETIFAKQTREHAISIRKGWFHMLVPGPRNRHSVYFSVIDSEWPAVKAGLEAMLRRE